MFGLFKRTPPKYTDFPPKWHRQRAERGLLSDRPEYLLTKLGRVVCSTCGGNCGQCADSLATGQGSMDDLVLHLFADAKRPSRKEQKRIREWLRQWDETPDTWKTLCIQVNVRNTSMPYTFERQVETFDQVMDFYNEVISHGKYTPIATFIKEE